MINVTEEEADNLATHLQQTRAQFDNTCLEKGGSMMVINTMPCHFLSNQKCTVYDYRFAGCREFPALHLPNFTKRIFTTFMHYNRCPIIYNVVEQLKIEIGFIETVITEAYY
jgi:Fe-S-cluster containining protein